ncbi:MAG: hypothetical protein C0604_03175 [Clostridiales bacterium]|nr:MAG: hypothetical protein C0604_03175 [Clostridiales bacterium]
MSRNRYREEHGKKILSYIRLARKSGSLIAGFDACVSESRKGNLKLIIACEDLSEGSKRNLENKCNELTKIIVFGQSSDLNKETGLSNKKILGIGNDNLADAIMKNHEMYMKS